MRQHAERSGDYATVSDPWSDLVYRFPFFHDLPRRRAFAGREIGRRHNGISRRTGNAESDSAYTTVTVWLGGGTDHFIFFGALDDWVGQRALRSGVAAALPEARRVDGSGGACGELHAGDPFRAGDSRWNITGIFSHAGVGGLHAYYGSFRAGDSGVRGYLSEHYFPAEPFAGDVQSFAGASLGWKYWDYFVHERRDGTKVSQLVA